MENNKPMGLFAASNSSKGFKNYYNKIFDRKKLIRLYIIKGGPGTGKSSLMKKVAEAAENKGCTVERFYCSSDPQSLDGILLDGKIGMVDGTAPHSVDTEIVGARDEIVNLGEFLDIDRLTAKFSAIEELCEKKKKYYAKGYKYLTGCGNVFAINRELSLPALKEVKMENFVERIMQGIPKGKGFSCVPTVENSVGMRGVYKSDFYKKCAEKLYCIIDFYDLGQYFISSVISKAQDNNIPIKISYDPVICDRVNSVYFCNSKTVFAVVKKREFDNFDCTKINMKRFADKEICDGIKEEYKYNQRLYDAFISSACDSFEQAGKCHFELEKIYSECMDFNKSDRLFEKLWGKIEKYL